MHGLDCESSVGHCEPPEVEAVSTLRSRLCMPWPHDALQMLHPPQILILQSTPHFSVLQLRHSDSAGHT
jgi:hypothetical protein